MESYSEYTDETQKIKKGVIFWQYVVKILSSKVPLKARVIIIGLYL